MRSSAGIVAVATSVPSASGTRARGACAPLMNSRCSQDDWKPKRQCGQVLSERQKEPTTNWPGLTLVTALPTSSTTPQYSWPIAIGAVTALAPQNGQRSELQMHDAERRITASVGLRIWGSGTSSQRTSRGPYRTAPNIFAHSFGTNVENRARSARARVQSMTRKIAGARVRN